HLAAKRAEQDYTRNAMRAGRALLKLKEIVGYGRWEQWLKDNRDRLGFAPRTARLYLQLAGLPETERQRVADLQLREAARTPATRNPLDRRRDPTLDAPLAAVVDGVVKLVRADVVVAYLHALQTPNECSPDRFREGARWVEQQ